MKTKPKKETKNELKFSINEYIAQDHKVCVIGDVINEQMVEIYNYKEGISIFVPRNQATQISFLLNFAAMSIENKKMVSGKTIINLIKKDINGG